MSESMNPSLGHGSIDRRVGALEDWRRLIVDPQLEEHGKKIQAFERIEMQITGVVRFVKIVAACVGGCVAVCELVRMVEPLLRK